MSRFIILIGSLALLLIILISFLIIQQKNNEIIVSDLDYVSLILVALEENIEILNYEDFEEYLVVLYKTDKDELNQRVFKVNERTLDYVSGMDFQVQSFYGTIQKYGHENYMIITGIKGSASHIDVYFHGSTGSVHTKYSKILDIEEEYFIIINQLDRQISYQFIVDPLTRMLDEVYEEIQ